MAEDRFETPYPTYDVLKKWDSPSYNDATRRVVAHRLNNRPERRFFTEREFALLRAIMDTVLPQDERDEATRVPLEAFIDDKLYRNVTDGTRRAGIPPQREAWREGLEAIDAEAKASHRFPFIDLSPKERHGVLQRIDGGNANRKLWKSMDGKFFFRHVLLKQAVKFYYGHPLGWNEIGFGGPAAPRGYVRLGPDMRDPWEAKEEREPQKAEKLP
jgi:hypothetical protein